MSHFRTEEMLEDGQQCVVMKKQTEIIAVTVVQWPFTAQGWKTSIRSFSLHEAKTEEPVPKICKNIHIDIPIEELKKEGSVIRIPFFQTCGAQDTKHVAGQRQWVWNGKKKNKNHIVLEFCRLAGVLFMDFFGRWGGGVICFTFQCKHLLKSFFEVRLGIHHRARHCLGGTDPHRPPLSAHAPASPCSRRGLWLRARPRPRRAPGRSPAGRAHVTAPEKWVKGRAAAAPPRAARASPAAPGLSTRAGKALPNKSSQRKEPQAMGEASASLSEQGKGCAQLVAAPAVQGYAFLEQGIVIPSWKRLFSRGWKNPNF